jgi:hypothetical protein
MSKHHFNARDHFGNPPPKPTPDFPLFPHGNGCWAKKIRGKLHYFGTWVNDHTGEEALKKYQAEKDDLHTGRKPRLVREEVTVKDVANAFLHHKQALVKSGELSPRTPVRFGPGFKRPSKKVMRLDRSQGAKLFREDILGSGRRRGSDRKNRWVSTVACLPDAVTGAR